MFELSKWYFDCVSAAGDVAILYQARLRCGPIRLAYGAALYKPATGVTSHCTTLRPDGKVLSTDGAIALRCPRLSINGSWSQLAPGFETMLLNGPQGHIHWQCVCPRAYADLSLGPHRVRGTGYVEHLTMTIKPWQLPFNELRWGRMVGRDDSLIWIDWRGDYARTWVWHNEEQSTCEVHEGRVEVPDRNLALTLQNTAVLRHGELNDTALRPLRALTDLLPRWHAAHETKWLAQAALHSPGRSDTGWSIHEVVRWE